MKSRTLRPTGRSWIVYLLPALLFYVIFMAYPLIDSIRLSFFNSGEFIGLDNYTRLFTDTIYAQRYFGALGNTTIFFVIHMLVQNVLGIIFAVILTQRTFKGRHFYQTIMFIPTTLAILVTGYLWKLLLNPVWSGALLTDIGLQALAQPWLGNESTALIFVSLVSCWQWVGIPTMMFVAAFNNISDDVLESADLDGATGWKTFWHIKVPIIKPVIGIVSILTFVNNFNAFDVVFAMENANGAPNYSTDLLGTLFYRVGIAGEHPIGIPDPGLGAAIASITFILLAICSIFALKFTMSKE